MRFNNDYKQMRNDYIFKIQNQKTRLYLLTINSFKINEKNQSKNYQKNRQLD